MRELRAVADRLRVAVALAVATAAVIARAGESALEDPRPLARGPGAAADLVVSAAPPVLVPGQDRVTLAVEGCPGTPLLAANAGRIASVRTDAPGRATAELLAPDERRPQVAIVTATCDGRHGWIAIPIVGRGTAIARTTPGAAIRVTIGARSFGPAVADAEGVARVPVDVPPGVRFAYQGERPLDLRVPPARRVHVAVDPPTGRADREEAFTVRAYVVTEAGAPRAGARVVLSAPDGVLSAPAEVEPGLLVARWTLPPGRAGPLGLEARLEDEPGEAVTATLERRAGPPARLEAAPDRAVAVAGEAPVQLDVRVVDAAGNLTASPLRVEPGAVVLDAREHATGRWAVGLEVPERLDGRDALDVSIVAGDATAAARVALSAAPAVALEVEAPAAPEVLADGEASLVVKVALQDRFGNPAVDPPPEARTEQPAEVSTVRDGDRFHVTVRPRRRLGPGADAVTIEGGGRTERLPLALRPAEPWLALGARAGYLAAAGGLRSAYAGVGAVVWPAAWGPFGAALEAGAFAHDRTDGVALAGAPLAVRGEVRYLPIVASARWRHAPSRGTVLVAAAGGAVAPLSAEVRVTGQPAVREHGVAPGAQVAFGAGWRLGTEVVFLEARGLWLADPGLDVVRGRVLATGLVVGWTHGLW